MNDSTISGPALRLHELIQSSSAFGPLSARHPDLLSAIIEASARAAECGKSDLLIEIVARATCTTDMALEASTSGNDTELAERMLLADQANGALGDLLRELVPERLPIGGKVIAPAS